MYFNTYSREILIYNTLKHTSYLSLIIALIIYNKTIEFKESFLFLIMSIVYSQYYYIDTLTCKNIQQLLFYPMFNLFGITQNSFLIWKIIDSKISLSFCIYCLFSQIIEFFIVLKSYKFFKWNFDWQRIQKSNKSYKLSQKMEIKMKFVAIFKIDLLFSIITVTFPWQDIKFKYTLRVINILLFILFFSFIISILKTENSENFENAVWGLVFKIIIEIFLIIDFGFNKEDVPSVFFITTGFVLLCDLKFMHILLLYKPIYCLNEIKLCENNWVLEERMDLIK